MADRIFQPETLAIHAGQIPDSATGARALPIYQTTSFVFDSADHAASLFNLQTFGNVYSRLSNPTVAALEERVAALEGGRAALASASGMAAEALALLTLLQQGDHVVAAGALYGGSVSMLAGQPEEARHRDHLRRRIAGPMRSPRRCGRPRARCSPRASATRACTCSTSARSPTSRMRTACR
jgi:hypothetical protein